MIIAEVDTSGWKLCWVRTSYLQSLFMSCIDPTLTVENVTDVMEKITEDRRRQVWQTVLRIIDHYGYEQKARVNIYFDKIYSSHSSEGEKTHAYSDMYVNCHPESSWEHLTSHLYKEDEVTAIEQARTFLPPRG